MYEDSSNQGTQATFRTQEAEEAEDQAQNPDDQEPPMMYFA